MTKYSKGNGKVSLQLFVSSVFSFPGVTDYVSSYVANHQLLSESVTEAGSLVNH